MEKRTWLIAFALLTLTTLACGFSDLLSPTPFPACTPPACAEGEVYYCPGECPLGCGTECATPTPTLYPVCTPPACAPDEVYYCPGECIGGCGTECATPTPGASGPTPSASEAPPEILYFTAEPEQVVEGQEVTFSWEATGAIEARIEWTNRSAILESMSVDPAGGSETFVPQNRLISLRVENSAGVDSETIELDMSCAHEWAPALAENPPTTENPPIPAGCPKGGQYGPAAQQLFENGLMIWWGPEDTIYVLYSDGHAGSPPQYQSFVDEFEEGDLESDPDIVPPEGLYQPIRGFGLIWRTHPEVRERVGWATAPEAGFETWTQDVSGQGMHSQTRYIEGIDGTIYKLGAMGSTWEVYEP